MAVDNVPYTPNASITIRTQTGTDGSHTQAFYLAGTNGEANTSVTLANTTITLGSGTLTAGTFTLGGSLTTTNRLDVSGAITPTITLAGLANSTTVARQSTTLSLADGNGLVPPIVDVDFFHKTGGSGIANGGNLYLFVAESDDGTNFTSGAPAIGTSDANFTFTTTPTTSPTSLRQLGAISFNANNEARRERFYITNPPKLCAFIVLNYTGTTMSTTSSDCGIVLYKRFTDQRS